MVQNRTCSFCGTAIVGRSDKIFCSDQCRASSNNRAKNISEKNIIDTNKRMRRNRTILKTLCPIGKSTVRKSVLVDLGFDFSSFTSMYLSPNGQLYYLSYDYGFSPIVQKGIDKALIITKQNYVRNWQPWKYINK